MPDITLFFLQASRSIRVAWLLEELGLDYKLEFSDREGQKAPQEFKDKSGNPLGKFPSMRDGELNVYESGAIVEYLIDQYDTDHKLLPKTQPERSRAQVWLHAAEGTFMIHGLAIMYSRWNFPENLAKSNPEAIESMEKGLSVNVQRDLDWLEDELSKSKGPYLLGDKVTVADVMMEVTIDFILERGLGTKGKSWPKVNEWLKVCQASEGYKRAVQKTGHTLHPKTT